MAMGSNNRDIIEFVDTPPILNIRITGCHGNHAFSQSPNMCIIKNIFSYLGGPRSNLAPARNCPKGKRKAKLDEII